MTSVHHGTGLNARTIRGISIGDLDTAEIVRTVEEAIRRQRLEDPGTRDPMEPLRGLGLLNGDTILNAAVVLFIKPEGILTSYPQCQLKLARWTRQDRVH